MIPRVEAGERAAKWPSRQFIQSLAGPSLIHHELALARRRAGDRIRPRPEIRTHNAELLANNSQNDRTAYDCVTSAASSRRSNCSAGSLSAGTLNQIDSRQQRCMICWRSSQAAGGHLNYPAQLGGASGSGRGLGGQQRPTRDGRTGSGGTFARRN